MPKTYNKEKVDTLPDGTILDVDSFDWGEFKDLSKRIKKMIIWYTLPNQKGFKCFSQAGIMAGFTTKSAYTLANQVRLNPRYQEAIKLFEDRFQKTTIADAFAKALEMKVKRMSYSIKDFYNSVEITNEETGDSVTRLCVKPINEIDNENAKLIDNIDINQSGIGTYKLPNREKEINDIIKLNSEINKEKSTGDYDVQTTIDVIRDTLNNTKVTVQIANQKVRENAENYIENSENQPDFD